MLEIFKKIKINEKSNEINSDILKLKNDKTELEKKISELQQLYENINKKRNSYSLIKRIIKKKDYDKLIQQELDIISKISDLESKIQNILISIDVQNKVLEKELFKLENANKLSEIISYQEMESYFNNVQFMDMVVSNNPFNICYDRTNNIELYKKYIKMMIEIYKNKPDSEFVHNNFALDEDYNLFLRYLENEEFLKDETNLKLVHYAFEKIRWINKVGFPSLFIYFDNAFKYYNTEFGRELEKLYNNPDYIIGMHATSSNNYVSGENSFFTKGIMLGTGASGRANKNDYLSYTVFYGVPFISLLDYKARPASANECYILTLPRKNVYGSGPVLGSDMNRITDGYTYILPDYIYGYVDYHEKDDLHIVRNNAQNKKKYKYLFSNDGTCIKDLSEIKTL